MILRSQKIVEFEMECSCRSKVSCHIAKFDRAANISSKPPEMIEASSSPTTEQNRTEQLKIVRATHVLKERKISSSSTPASRGVGSLGCRRPAAVTVAVIATTAASAVHP